eukprot:Platyproteum_vivax@DN5759_c0_g1_i1.p1
MFLRCCRPNPENNYDELEISINELVPFKEGGSPLNPAIIDQIKALHDAVDAIVLAVSVHDYENAWMDLRSVFEDAMELCNQIDFTKIDRRGQVAITVLFTRLNQESKIIEIRKLENQVDLILDERPENLTTMSAVDFNGASMRSSTFATMANHRTHPETEDLSLEKELNTLVLEAGKFSQPVLPGAPDTPGVQRLTFGRAALGGDTSYEAPSAADREKLEQILDQIMRHLHRSLALIEAMFTVSFKVPEAYEKLTVLQHQLGTTIKKCREKGGSTTRRYSLSSIKHRASFSSSNLTAASPSSSGLVKHLEVLSNGTAHVTTELCNRLTEFLSNLNDLLWVKKLMFQFVQLERVALLMEDAENNKEAWISYDTRSFTLAYTNKEDGYIVVQCDGMMACPTYQLLCIIYESDLHQHWVPFLKDSKRIAVMSQSSQIVNQVFFFPPPLSNREGRLFGFGVDALSHDRHKNITVIASSLPDNTTEWWGVQIAPENPKLVRMHLDFFSFFLYPKEDGTTHVKFLCSVDPKMDFLPKSVINFVIRTMAAEVFKNIAKQSEKFENGPFSKRIKESPELYTLIEKRLAEHHGTSVTPSRPNKTKPKAKAKSAPKAKPAPKAKAGPKGGPKGGPKAKAKRRASGQSEGVQSGGVQS